MTSNQIADETKAVQICKDSIGGENSEGFAACAFWLREIAYQLAVANEHKQIELQRQSEVLNS